MSKENFSASSQYILKQKHISEKTEQVFALTRKNKMQSRNQDVRLSDDEINNMPMQNLKYEQIFNTFGKQHFQHFLNYFTKKLNQQIVIYSKKSNILVNNAIKEELLTKSEQEQRRISKDQFKRSLLVERIHFKFPKKSNNLNPLLAMRVSWSKLPILTSPVNKISKVLSFENARTPGFPNEYQKLLLNNFQNFPIFSIENNLRQIILSYPPEAFAKNWADRLYDWYYRIFEWEKDTRGTNLGFFFFNPSNAELYEHNVRDFGALSAHDLGTKLSVFKLSTAYELSRTSPPETRFMFIPDIEEIGNLLNVYKKNYGKKMQFHTKQKISKLGFANQPIYVIQPTRIKTNLFKSKVISYNGKLKDHVYIFCSLDGAETAWKKFREELGENRLPKRPNLLVYNFNSFIKDYENGIIDFGKNIILVPNRQTWETLEVAQTLENKKTKLQNFYDQYISSKIYFSKLWIKRFRLVLFHAPRVNEYPRRELLLPSEDNNKD
uniref:Conserved hypothetical plastid protein n=1 Tax=Bangiopsis subsimplex TaxID=139980 RepID=A0A1C9CCN5_9RHOD|nr:hypothetical protein Bangp_053 [Bangiopsis subsimplex]AOM66135.1 hypothetical protein Bangp_053 [Bangiopsis subsimplex]ARO90308.1 conserved hypothetical plastid protein [Bangiopsis subsimplex]